MNEDRRKGLLDDRICEGLEKIADMEPGTEEYSEAVEAISKLYKLQNEETKTDIDYDEKYTRRDMERTQNEIEVELKREELAEAVKSRYYRTGLEIGSLGLSLITLMAYLGMMKQGYKYEEQGALVSHTFREGRNLFSRFLKIRK